VGQLSTLYETLSRSSIGPSAPPVWTADISYWISGNQKTDLQSESGYLDFCTELGCMPYYWYDAFWAGERSFDCSVDIVQGKICEESGERTTEWVLGPGGGSTGKSLRRLSRIDRFSATSWSEATVKHAIENSDDLRLLIELVESSKMIASLALETHALRQDRWEAYDGYPCIGLPRSPVSAFINEWAGVENGLILLFEERELCNRLFSILEEQEQPIIEACTQKNVQLVHFPDNLTSDVYTSIFDDSMRGCYERRIATLHDGGTFAAVHLDGTVRGLLPKLCESGIDAVEAVTPHPVGDCTAGEMRNMASGSNTVLWGGVPGAMFARPYSWLDMKAHVEEVLEMWRGAPFVLGVADQVPPDGDIDTVRRIADLVARGQS
jgi:hypothetical protein